MLATALRKGALAGSAVGLLEVLWVLARAWRLFLSPVEFARYACFATAAMAAAGALLAFLLAALVPSFARHCALPMRSPRRRALATLAALSLIGSAVPQAWALRDAPNLRYASEQAAPLGGALLSLLPRRRPPPQAAAGFGAAATTAGGPPAPPGLDLRGRDVLLITVDALRADRLAPYGGHGLTPELDALAEEAVVFLRAQTTTPHTSYALAGLLTGKYMRPIFTLGGARSEHPTLPKLLRQHGYRTAAFFPPAIFFVDAERFVWLRQDNFGFEYVKAMYAKAGHRVEQLRRYLQTAAPGRPLFVWVHLFEPHEPYDPPPHRKTASFPEARYDGEVAEADAAVGALVRAFRAKRPGATVIVTADHGEEFGEHGGRYHGTSLFDEQLQVPLLWSSPGAARPRQLQTPVELIDLPTTLLSALGIAAEARMRGDDLSPLLAGAAPPSEGHAHAHASLGDLRSVGDGRFKLICRNSETGCRLFDRTADPGEYEDLAAARSAERERLKAQLSQFAASIAAHEAIALPDGAGWPPALARAQLGERVGAAELAPLLENARPVVRAAAARVLAGQGERSARATLERVARHDSDADVRAEAAIAALRLEPTAASAHVAPVLALLEPGSDRGRRAALALGAAGVNDRRVSEQLLAVAFDATRDESERVAAIEAFATVRTPERARWLLPLLPEVRLRKVVASALEAMAQPAAAQALARALETERYATARLPLVRALFACGQQGRALSALIRHLGRESSVPGGLGFLLQRGKLQGAGLAAGDLREPASAPGRGWHCTTSGCQPRAGALLSLPAVAVTAGARLILRVAATGAGTMLRVAGVERALHPGIQEIGFAFDAASGGQLPVEVTSGAWIEAYLLVERVEEIPPPPPQPWQPSQQDGDDATE
ncbi:MAG: sulfatase [Myxococcales bacterium]|nr:sulfatase [Myxococcales bacterium]